MATILVVDDNAALSRMLARFLEANGHRALVAHSGAEALAAAAAQPAPDLILLDLSMPEMDGLEVLRKLKHLDQQRQSDPAVDAEAPGVPTHTPIIFFSAIDDPAIIKSALAEGAREYWVKASFKFKDLPAAIARYVPARTADEPDSV